MEKTQVLSVEYETAEFLSLRCTNALDPSMKNGTVIFDKEVTFDDGNRMVIQVVNSSNDPAWCQGVLYDPDGNELGTTEVLDQFLGSYCVDYDGTTYITNVRKLGQKATYVRYFVIRVETEIDGRQTDQDMDNFVDEIMQEVVNECDYMVTFNDKVCAGEDEDNSVEVPVKIVATELVEMRKCVDYEGRKSV